MPVRGADVVAKNIIKFGGGFTNHVNKQMVKIRDLLDKQVTENISQSDHSLKDLSKLGHPYASRWGTSKASALHTPYWLVHRQSGGLLGSKYSGVNNATVSLGVLRASAFVGLDENKAKYAASIVYGTSRMIPRPVLVGSRDQIIKPAHDILSHNLKNFVLSFYGDRSL